MSTSPLLPEPITISLWGTDDKRTFERVSDVIDWLEGEQREWTEATPTNAHLKKHWESLRGFAGRTLGIAREIEKLLQTKGMEQFTDTHVQQLNQLQQSLAQHLSKYSNGEVINRCHPFFSHAQVLAEADADAGASLLLACLSNGSRLLGQAGGLDAIARIGPSHAYLDLAKRKTIKTLKAELSILRKRADEDIAEVRGLIDQEVARTREREAIYQATVEERGESWKALTAKCNEEWDELKRIYDEKLALLAPTEYWRDRSIDHKKRAKHYAYAFGGALATFLAVFGWLGVTHLIDPGTESVVLAVLPVLVPAFAGIWVLRILGRLLSENLMIAQDAHERETMVKTFLALMRDETTGKEVITDEDRKIILHALFRPSAVTATDDAPPLHYLEAFKSK
ncbi:DUF6161 domain-containing protein [Lysobacter sp. GX 14042]|uniref:DUF6161 domain-containing protein n=1 Tax=Lysobacter sp. GX 14042 TaxID=2907155 RepID=UPI001F1F3B0A|nr:DUF6161 domain-containing protein [Lysobacter sp. GX 14042]MCE7032624.1 DUF6161 domain-containing protein [Lysobacter sp. GX 14042]